MLTEKRLRRGVYRSTRVLEEAIARYVESTNAHAKPFVWTKSADDILASLSRFCMRRYHSGHWRDDDASLQMSRFSLNGLSLRAVECIIEEGNQFQGSTTSMPVASKSRTLRVTRTAPRERDMAAI